MEAGAKGAGCPRNGPVRMHADDEDHAISQSTNRGRNVFLYCGSDGSGSTLSAAKRIIPTMLNTSIIIRSSMVL